MNLEDLKRVVVSFADNKSDVVIERGKILAEIRGELIEAKIESIDGSLFITENEKRENVRSWITNRLACLHQLADRIYDYTPSISNFIDPTGKILDDIDFDPTETENPICNITDHIINKLSRNTIGTSNVMYLTSDAGEGKTTIINHIAKKQALEFKSKKTNWLLVPIPLGGRPFLRFDDIVIASFVNHLRFRLFYYDSFIELVKLGILVPAFDGFEEMFMESSSGEAVSATGHLMSKLNSSGTILIAARQAYFDYKSFSAQAKLFDTIGSNSVLFSKFSINRWNKEQFLQYAGQRNIIEAVSIYDFFEEKLGSPNHPLLTRPVLVNQLFEVVKNKTDLIEISSSLDHTADYFPKFVDAIIKREAETKWIDRSGEPYKSLLTVEEHYEILSLLAEEMWLNNTESLHESIIDLLSEMYCEAKQFTPLLSRQIKERIKQHALIVKSELNQSQFKFDHEEFKEFFLGIAFVNKFKNNQLLDIKNLMRRGVIFSQTSETIIAYLKKDSGNIENIITLIKKIQFGESPTSFIKENNGTLIIKLLSNTHYLEDIDNCIFSCNSLLGVNLKDIVFKNCYFQSTNFHKSTLVNCLFINCIFDRIEFSLEDGPFSNVLFKDCEIISVQDTGKEISYYDPYHIKSGLKLMNIEVVSSDEEKEKIIEREIAIEEDLELVEKILKSFIRSTYLNDRIFRMKLGLKAVYFLKNILPQLIQHNIISEVENSGLGGRARRFRLIAPFDKIYSALSTAEGSFEKFLEGINTKS